MDPASLTTAPEPRMTWTTDETSLTFKYDSETVHIEAWGPNAFRVRATHESTFPFEDWALTEPVSPSSLAINLTSHPATATNGNITATISPRGKLAFTNQHGQPLLTEYARHRLDLADPKCSALQIPAREFTPRLGSDTYRLVARFEAPRRERLFGMGQYQQPNLDLRGADLELAQRNSQASVPFVLSDRGYGLLWNNPAVGRAVFGTNVYSFEARSTRVLDYWVVAGDTPGEVCRTYTAVTGRVPEAPEYMLGFWQCKLRYQTQEEVLQVAREHVKERKLPMDVIVVDFFHWPKEGEWKFDPTFWPDPDAMIAELKSLGVELMVSVWPTVDRRSENYQEMVKKGLLVRQDRGWRISMEGNGNCIHIDPTNPETRRYVWDKVKKNYYDKGIQIFWLDEAEPEYSIYDFDIYRYHKGPNLMVGNSYPVAYSRLFYEGMQAAGQDKVVNLVRCAWAGSQKYGALLWSGDIASSWDSLRDQLSAGLNAGLAGIAWWTTDIGGFHGGDPSDPGFRELFVRWFQWAAFCPVMRLHGDREPRQDRVGTTGGSHCCSGAANEVWSYGEEVYGICQTYLGLRERMRGYIRELMESAHQHGDPIMRPVFYDFPADQRAWDIDDQYMFGSRYLVAPVLQAGVRQRKLYLPEGADWRQIEASGDALEEVEQGGRIITVETPLAYLPVFERVG